MIDEFVKVLVERLEEQKSGLTDWEVDVGFEIGIEKSIEIVNQLAEEYKGGGMIW